MAIGRAGMSRARRQEFDDKQLMTNRGCALVLAATMDSDRQGTEDAPKCAPVPWVSSMLTSQLHLTVNSYWASAMALSTSSCMRTMASSSVNSPTRTWVKRSEMALYMARL